MKKILAFIFGALLFCLLVIGFIWLGAYATEKQTYEFGALMLIISFIGNWRWPN